MCSFLIWCVVLVFYQPYFTSFFPLPPAPWKVMLSQSHLPKNIADFYNSPYGTFRHYGAY